MSAQAAFRDRLAWIPEQGELRDGEARYVLMRHDSLMGLFRNLPESARGAALDALAASVALHGARSAERYRRAGGEGDALLATIEATAPQLGWGVWRIERAGAELRLEVENSPFAAGHGPSSAPVCAPIAGMLQAVAGLVLGAPARAREDACAAAGASMCRFHAVRSEKDG